MHKELRNKKADQIAHSETRVTVPRIRCIQVGATTFDTKPKNSAVLKLRVSSLPWFSEDGEESLCFELRPTQVLRLGDPAPGPWVVSSVQPRVRWQTGAKTYGRVTRVTRTPCSIHE